MADKNPLPDLFRFLTIGTEFGITVGLLVFGGLWLDRRLGTMPVFTLTGTFVGLGVGLYNMIRLTRKMQNQDKKR